MLVLRFSLMPMIPHANTRYFHGTGSDSFWLEGTMELMRRCDGVYLIDGWEVSSGSRAEKAEAEGLGLKVFTSSDHKELGQWSKSER